LTRLTRDHSLVQDLVDAGMIDRAEAEAHPNAHIITRAVGAAERLQPETVAGETRPGDLFLLASDGLTRVVDDDELLAALHGDDLEASADRLLQLALDRDAPDNVSLIIVRAKSDAAEAGSGSRMILQHGHDWPKE
jgi:serine/threonine protein phosphatase PrpC